jgi:hypothetical protein
MGVAVELLAHASILFLGAVLWVCVLNLIVEGFTNP